MSATFRSRRPGYSLIEVLVILALLGMVAAIATPRFESLVESVGFDTAVQSLAVAVRDARITAYRTRRETHLGDAVALVDLPAGWNVSYPEPVVITARGVCLGGEMHVETPARSFVWNLEPPRCQPSADGSR